MKAPKWLQSSWDSFRYYTKGFYIRFNEEKVLFLASGIAFNGILCLLPLLLLLTSVVGIFLQSSHIPSQKIDEMLNSIFPAQPYAQKIQSSLKGVILDIIRYRSTFGLYGAAILVWTATSLFSSLRIVTNTIYRIKTSKLVVVKIFENILLVVLVGLLFFVANAFTWIVQGLKSFFENVPALSIIDFGLLHRSMPFLVSYIPAFVMFFIINRYLPDRIIDGRVALLSALTATTLWWVAAKGFAWYLSAFHSYSKLYGTYAFFIVFIAWIYYSSLVFVVGVVIGQLYRERRSLLPPTKIA